MKTSAETIRERVERLKHLAVADDSAEMAAYRADFTWPHPARYSAQQQDALNAILDTPLNADYDALPEIDLLRQLTAALAGVGTDSISDADLVNRWPDVPDVFTNPGAFVDGYFAAMVLSPNVQASLIELFASDSK